MSQLHELTVLIKGGGEVASAVAHRLQRSRFRVCLTERARPLAVCRGVAFSEAVSDGKKTIEGVTAELAEASSENIHEVFNRGNIAIAIDPYTSLKEKLKPDVFIDAAMAKRSTGTSLADAPLVIGLGPGFHAGRDVHAVVETNHDNNLGRVILEGAAEKNTGAPITVGGLSKQRVIWASRDGIFTSGGEIGKSVSESETVGRIEGDPIEAPVSGILRGLLRSGTNVSKGAKLIEVDPVNRRDVCFTIRDKMRAIAGGALEAILMKLNTL